MSARIVNEYRPTWFNRSKVFPSVNSKSVKLQVSNVLARNCKTTGVQGAPKSFIGSIMRNVETKTFDHRAG